CGECLELVAGSRHGRAFVGVAGGDRAGGGGDRAQGAKPPAGDEPADRGGGRRDDRQGDAGDDRQLLPVHGDLPKTRHADRRLWRRGGGGGHFSSAGGGGRLGRVGWGPGGE